MKTFASRYPILIALALSLAAAVSLGIARFSYALLLSPMREDLGWSYLLAGTMNTANAFGYLVGALITPQVMRRFGTQKTLVGGAGLTAVFMLFSGLSIEASLLLGQRVLAGLASAFLFISGGILAARLSALHPERTGFLLGLYYGGTGFGIVLSALLVPEILAYTHMRNTPHAWQWAWFGLSNICLWATLILVLPASSIEGASLFASRNKRFRIRDFRYGLGGYFMFGMGYIGYMTFIVALLKEQGLKPQMITWFYTALGVAVIASSRIWAGLLDRFKGGETMAILNILLATATILPVLTVHPIGIFASGLLFGAVFLSVVASTTALVRHNLPQQDWAAGISAFTTVFALGQIIGPTIAGWISDSTGGLQFGLLFSAVVLVTGGFIALRQSPLPTPLSDQH